MRNCHARRYFLLTIGLLASGCTTSLTSSPTTAQHAATVLEPAQHCRAFMQAVDTAINDDGVNDAQHHRLASYPYLRSSRSLAAEILRSPSGQGGQGSQDGPGNAALYLPHLQALGREGWAIETANLSHTQLRALATRWRTSRQAINTQLQHCAEGAVQQLLSAGSGTDWESIAREAQVPSGYQAWQRWVGLYPLTGAIVANSIEQENQKTLAKFNTRAKPTTTSNRRVRFSPATAASTLIARFAPIIEIDQGDRPEYNTLVKLVWRNQQLHTSAKPIIYTYWSRAIWQGKTMRQLNYVMWFKGRPKTSSLDLLGGKLDGLIWRVTLDDDDQPLFFDTIHNCGCYHQFFPVSRTGKPMPINPRPQKEATFVPMQLQLADIQARRVVLHIEANTHYLHNLSFEDNHRQRSADSNYQFAAYKQLRQLPWPHIDRDSKSVFDREGMIEGSERLERFLLWPFGVPSPGKMRQAGHHATAFIGERYFDDPWLFVDAFGDRRDIIRLPRRPPSPITSR